MGKLLAGLGVVAALALPFVAASEPAGGMVFEDLNANGVRDGGEPGVPGVYVQRGAEISRTDGNGRYALEGVVSIRTDAGASNTSAHSNFVVLTRPRDFDCDVWYRLESGDFALRRRDSSHENPVFVQMSDAHVSDMPADIGRFGIPGPIGRMPRWLAGTSMWLMLRVLGADLDRDAVVASLREKLGKRYDVAGMGDTALMGTFVRDLVASPEELVDPAGDFRAALRELRSMGPAFVVSTGDLVVDSNKGDAADIERWMKFYAQETRATGLRFYDTIGNNELAGTENDSFGIDEPGYGKGLFRGQFGPTFYSFDRGDLHFVALDTHRHLDPASNDWSVREMEDEVREWLAADLAAHRDRRIVVLNHEPFRADPAWSIPKAFRSEVDDQGWLEDFSVPYTFTGHLHINGTTSGAGTQHVMTGALSGTRWSLPARAYPRGYRLVQVRDGELFTAWKRLAEPLLGFVTPTDSELYATAPLSSDPKLVVIAAADAAGPFAEVSLKVDGESVPLERWSDFFLAARLDRPSVDATLHIQAKTRDGRLIERKVGGREVERGNKPPRSNLQRRIRRR